MMSMTALTLVLYIAWTLSLLIVMESIRSYLVFSGKVPANGFSPDNSNLSPFMQRLARAHANCLEGFPIFGGLLIAALLLDAATVTDPLAPWLLGARLLQSIIHLASIGNLAVTMRFMAFAVQLGIAAVWTWMLLSI